MRTPKTTFVEKNIHRYFCNDISRQIKTIQDYVNLSRPFKTVQDITRHYSWRQIKTNQDGSRLFKTSQNVHATKTTFIDKIFTVTHVMIYQDQSRQFKTITTCQDGSRQFKTLQLTTYQDDSRQFKTSQDQQWCQSDKNNLCGQNLSPLRVYWHIKTYQDSSRLSSLRP